MPIIISIFKKGSIKENRILEFEQKKDKQKAPVEEKKDPNQKVNQMQKLKVLM